MNKNVFITRCVACDKIHQLPQPILNDSISKKLSFMCKNDTFIHNGWYDFQINKFVDEKNLITSLITTIDNSEIISWVYN